MDINGNDKYLRTLHGVVSWGLGCAVSVHDYACLSCALILFCTNTHTILETIQAAQISGLVHPISCKRCIAAFTHIRHCSTGVYSRVAAQVSWVDEVICDGSKRQEAWSPQSCTPGPNSKKQLTDFATSSMEAKIHATRGLEDTRRLKVSLTFENAASHYGSNRNATEKRVDVDSEDVDSELIPLTDSCELLEGLYFRMPSPDDGDGGELETGAPTSSPTRPTHPTRPKEERGPDESIPAARQCDAEVDVPNGFTVRQQKIRTCTWVKRKRRRRCQMFANCCPCTCHPTGSCPAGR